MSYIFFFNHILLEINHLPVDGFEFKNKNKDHVPVLLAFDWKLKYLQVLSNLDKMFTVHFEPQDWSWTGSLNNLSSWETFAVHLASEKLDDFSSPFNRIQKENYLQWLFVQND